MHRIDTPNAVSGLFVEEQGTQPRTIAGADWLNAGQEELATMIEAEGLTLDLFDTTQLREALLLLLLFGVSTSSLLGAFHDFTAPANMVAGDAFYLKNAAPNDFGLLIVATETVLQGATSSFQLKGNAVLPKETVEATAFVPGQVVYWDWQTNLNCHDNGGTGRRIIGYSRTTEGSGAPTVEVRLNGTSDSSPP